MTGAALPNSTIKNRWVTGLKRGIQPSKSVLSQRGMRGGQAPRWSRCGMGLSWIPRVSLGNQLAELVSVGGSEGGGWGGFIPTGTTFQQRISPAFRLTGLQTHPLSRVTFDQFEAQPFMSCHSSEALGSSEYFVQLLTPLTARVCVWGGREAGFQLYSPSQCMQQGKSDSDIYFKMTVIFTVFHSKMKSGVEECSDAFPLSWRRRRFFIFQNLDRL